MGIVHRTRSRLRLNEDEHNSFKYNYCNDTKPNNKNKKNDVFPLFLGSDTESEHSDDGSSYSPSPPIQNELDEEPIFDRTEIQSNEEDEDFMLDDLEDDGFIVGDSVEEDEYYQFMQDQE